MSYKIEDDLEFYNMLYSELNKKETPKQESKCCLISKQPLDNTRIKLMCGHEFNYNPLYREIKKQKMHHNHLSIVRLKKNQLQCPYCRNIQDKVLPYKPYEGVTKCYGVNSPPSYEMLMDKCSYVFKSGKRKNQPCNKHCNGKYCNGHLKLVEKQKEKLKKKEEMKENTIIDNSSILDVFGSNTTNPLNIATLTVVKLKSAAKELKIKGYYKMRKADLITEVLKKMNLDKKE